MQACEVLLHPTPARALLSEADLAQFSAVLRAACPFNAKLVTTFVVQTNGNLVWGDPGLIRSNADVRKRRHEHDAGKPVHVATGSLARQGTSLTFRAKGDCSFLATPSPSQRDARAVDPTESLALRNHPGFTKQRQAFKSTILDGRIFQDLPDVGGRLPL